MNSKITLTNGGTRVTIDESEINLDASIITLVHEDVATKESDK